jgi:CRP/FNR family transcriptional regulator
MDKKTLLKFFPQFDVPLIDKLLEIGEIRSYPEHTLLQKKGSYFRSTMIVLDGVIDVYREDEDGKQFLMYTLTHGEACALSMLCAAKNEMSEITAICATDVQLFVLPIQYISELLREYPNWYMFVIESYRKRFDDMLALIDNVAFKAMDERLEFYLKRKAENLENDVLSITHQQIADDLNSSREVISRLLKKMEYDGKLDLGRNLIRVRNKPRV